MDDYHHFLLRPQLALRRDYRVLGEKSEWKELWDKDVKRVLSLFSKNRFSKKRDVKKEAMESGISKRRFLRIYDFCLERQFLFQKHGQDNVALAKRGS